MAKKIQKSPKKVATDAKEATKDGAKDNLLPGAPRLRHHQEYNRGRYGWKGRLQFFVSLAVFMYIVRFWVCFVLQTTHTLSLQHLQILESFSPTAVLDQLGVGVYFNEWAEKNKSWLRELSRTMGHVPHAGGDHHHHF